MRSVDPRCLCDVVQTRQRLLVAEAVVGQRADCPVHGDRVVEDGKHIVSVFRLEADEITATEGDMRDYVRLFREGDNVALSTNITDEAEFLRKGAQALGAFIEGNADSTLTFRSTAATPGEFIEAWLPQFVDVVCKLRGYKAPSVDEQIVLTVGRISPNETQMVATSEPNAFVEAVA